MMIVEKVMSRKPGYQRIDSVWGRGAGRVGGRLVRGVLLACRARGGIDIGAIMILSSSSAVLERYE